MTLCISLVKHQGKWQGEGRGFCHAWKGCFYHPSFLWSHNRTYQVSWKNQWYSSLNIVTCSKNRFSIIICGTDPCTGVHSLSSSSLAHTFWKSLHILYSHFNSLHFHSPRISGFIKGRLWTMIRTLIIMMRGSTHTVHKLCTATFSTLYQQIVFHFNWK